MRVRRVPLFEFMPYGAPDLMEVAQKYMFRATLMGMATVMGIMLAFALTNFIIAIRYIFGGLPSGFVRDGKVCSCGEK